MARSSSLGGGGAKGFKALLRLLNLNLPNRLGELDFLVGVVETEIGGGAGDGGAPRASIGLEGGLSAF